MEKSNLKPLSDTTFEIDLIVCAAIQKDYRLLQKSVDSVKNVSRKGNYILFDGAPPHASQERGQYYFNQQQLFKEYFPDFNVVSRTDNMYFKPNLEKFVREQYNSLSEYLLILQDDVQMESDIDIKLVVNKMRDTEDCRIVFFGENRPRALHWFNMIDDKDTHLTKLHGWSERVFVIKKSHLIDIFNYLRGTDGIPMRGGKNGKFIEAYYQNKMLQKSWEYLPDFKKLEYWYIWGCYVWKNVYHKHLVAKR
jgi:hypothetical protein